MTNKILNHIDFYKADHKSQYPLGTQMIYSNWTPRTSRIKSIDKVVLFGLQYYIKEYLIRNWNENFFDKDIDEVVEKYSRRLSTSLINVNTQHIRELHELGYLPLEIKAIPEGKSVKIGIPMFTIENTHEKFSWLTNYIETSLSSIVWQPCTSATIAKKYREIFLNYISQSGGDIGFVDFMGHDFSYRGMSSHESACLSGAGHLLSFKGTDTIPAIDFLEDYYNADAEKELIGCSVPATEHSVMCAGSKESELETYKRLINEVYPEGIVSIVSDTWDYWNVWTNIIPELKSDILARYSKNQFSKVVIRPDSGDPVDIICGKDCEEYDNLETAKRCVSWICRDEASSDCEGSHCCGFDSYSKIVKIKTENKFYNITVNVEYDRHDKTYYFVDSYKIGSCEEYIPTPEFLGSFELAWNLFGGKINDKGFKELHPAIGLIYGDSITLERAEEICKRLVKKGFVPAMVFGIGSFTYQYNTRDTFGFAIKATYAKVNGEGRNLFKEPKTDSGTKKSAKGLLALDLDENGDYVLIQEATVEQMNNSKLNTVFHNGNLIEEYSLETIRNNIKS